MNRRGFISSILLACVAPKVLIPKEKHAFHWKVKQRGELYVAEMEFNEMDFAGNWSFRFDGWPLQVDVNSQWKVPPSYVPHGTIVHS